MNFEAIYDAAYQEAMDDDVCGEGLKTSFSNFSRKVGEKFSPLVREYRDTKVEKVSALRRVAGDLEKKLTPDAYPERHLPEMAAPNLHGFASPKARAETQFRAHQGEIGMKRKMADALEKEDKVVGGMPDPSIDTMNRGFEKTGRRVIGVGAGAVGVGGTALAAMKLGKKRDTKREAEEDGSWSNASKGAAIGTAVGAGMGAHSYRKSVTPFVKKFKKLEDFDHGAVGDFVDRRPNEGKVTAAVHEMVDAQMPKMKMGGIMPETFLSRPHLSKVAKNTSRMIRGMGKAGAALTTLGIGAAGYSAGRAIDRSKKQESELSEAIALAYNFLESLEL